MFISFDLYKVFYVTAKNKSITAAARELFVTQPTVSHAIMKLEEALECVLFIRGKKGVELTPEGKVLYQRAKIACEQLWQGEAEINQLKKFDKGEIALGASETTLHHFIFPILKEYKKQYPDIRLKIYNNNTPRMIESLRDNKLDCGVLVAPAGYEEKDFAIIPLAEFQDVMIVSSKYKNLSGHPISLKALSSYPFIGLSPDTLTSQTLREYFLAHSITFKPDIELATTDLIVPAVENNLGIGIVPEAFAKDALENQRVFLLDLIEKIPKRTICLAYLKGKHQSIAAEAFIQYIRQQTQGSPS